MKRGLDQNTGSRKVQKLDPFELIDYHNINQLEEYIKHVDINKLHRKKAFDYTLLSYACYNGNSEIVELLLKKDGINVNYDGPLCWASMFGHIKIVKLLLKRDDIDVNYHGPLQCASHNGYIEIVQLLLKQGGIDINYLEPLTESCECGHIEIVQLLLKEKNIIIHKNIHVYSMLLKLERDDLLKIFTNQEINKYKQKWITEFNKIK